MRSLIALTAPLLLGFAVAMPALAQTPGFLSAPGEGIRAQIVAGRRVTLAAPMAGRLVEAPIRDGEEVARGAVVARFDCAVPEAQKAQAAATVARLQKIVESKARLVELGQASAPEIAVDRAAVAEAQAAVRLADALIARCSVRAPFAGRAAAAPARDAGYLAEGAPILELVAQDALELEAIVPSRWLTWLSPGQDFAIEVDETGTRHAATVTRISGAVDAVSQSVTIYASLAEAGPLRPGMSGRALLAPPEAAAAGAPPAP